MTRRTAREPLPTIPRCAIYLRCSADKQAEKDLSIPAQRDACRAAARERGWEVVGEYEDAAESARTDDRPAFRDMLQAARSKPRPFDFILVDGRAREACLERAHGLLSPRGVVALHDANRSFRRAPGGQFPSEAEFRDYRRWAGGLWLGSKGGSLSDVLDLGRHGRIWRMYNSLGKGFHL